MLMAANKAKSLYDTYKIFPSDYYAMMLNQNFCCGICGKEPKEFKFVVDHNHNTGKVRALLCNRCNIVLGMLESTPQHIMDKMVKYVIMYQ